MKYIFVILLLLFSIKAQTISDLTNWDYNNYYANPSNECPVFITIRIRGLDPITRDVKLVYGSISVYPDKINNFDGDYFEFQTSLPLGSQQLNLSYSSQTSTIYNFNCSLIPTPLSLGSSVVAVRPVSISSPAIILFNFPNFIKNIDLKGNPSLKASGSEGFLCNIESILNMINVVVACSIDSTQVIDPIAIDLALKVTLTSTSIDSYTFTVPQLFPTAEGTDPNPFPNTPLYAPFSSSAYYIGTINKPFNRNLKGYSNYVSRVLYTSGTPFSDSKFVIAYTFSFNQAYDIGYWYITNSTFQSYNREQFLVNISLPDYNIDPSHLGSSQELITYTRNIKVGSSDVLQNQISLKNLTILSDIVFPFSISQNLKSQVFVNQNIIFPYNPFFEGSLLYADASTTFQPTTSLKDNLSPTILSYEIISLRNSNYLVRVVVSDLKSGVYKIFGSTSKLLTPPFVFEMDYRDLSSGSLLNGTFEKVVKSFSIIKSIWAFDFVGNEFKLGIPMFTFAVPNLNTVSTLPSFDRFYFQLNDVNLSDIGCQNNLIFNFTENFTSDYRNSSSVNSEVRLTIMIDLNPVVFIGQYINSVKSYIVPFNLPPRMFTSTLEYSIDMDFFTLSSQALYGLLGNKSELRIFSNMADRMPPLIIELTPFTNLPNSIGWNISITDNFNGFSHGYVKFRSVLNDYLNYTIPLSVDGKNKTKDIYTVQVDFVVCNDYMYQIYDLMLVDQGGATSRYNYFEPVPNYINPFIKYGNSIGESQMQCIPEADSLLPFLSSSTTIDYTVDVCSENRSLSFVFKIEDYENRVSIAHLPIVSLTAINGQQVSFPTETNSTFDEKTVFFTANFNIPFGFGYSLSPNQFLVASVYGYSDSILNTAGTANFDVINITCSNYFLLPIIESHIPYYSTLGGSLTIFGKNFNNPNFKAVLNNNDVSTNIQIISPTVLVINNVPPIYTTISVYVINSNPVKQSNTYVIPYNPSLLFLQPLIIVPCQGNPKCGGPSNGDCTSLGCICKNNWQGIDCLSRIINTTEPIINTTSPNTNNGISTQSPNGQTVELKSLISIVSLNEIDFNGKSIKQYPLELWTFTNLTESSNQVYNHYLYNKTIQTSTITTTDVKVYIQWYKIKSSIQFAGETLSMNPSTLKYNIEISKYKFSSPLNHLELVFSASLQSTNSDSSTSCSYQENGNVVNENSEYMKLQVNSNSLYGRFVKRAIIDNRVQIIDNKFSNIKDTDSNSISKQTISILIPHYESSVQLDPDFSLLIDSDTAESKSGSSCDSKSKGLTRNQLIGIIVGSVVGGFILISIIILLVIKNTTNPKILKVAVKLRRIVGKN